MIDKLFQNEFRKIFAHYPIWIMMLIFLIISYLLCHFFIISNPASKQTFINNYFDTVYMALYVIFNLTFILWGFIFMYSTNKETSSLNIGNIYPVNVLSLLITRFLALYALFFICLFIIISTSFFLSVYSLSHRMILSNSEFIYFGDGFVKMSSHLFILSLPFLITAFVLPMIIRSTALNVTIIFLCHYSSSYNNFQFNPFRSIITAFSMHHSILTGNHLITSVDILPKYFVSIIYIIIFCYSSHSFLTRKQL
jgi:hypothetical protein